MPIPLSATVRVSPVVVYWIRDHDAGYSLSILIRIIEQVEKNLFKERVCKDFERVLRQVEGDSIRL